MQIKTEPTLKTSSTLLILSGFILQTSLFLLFLIFTYFLSDSPNASVVIGTIWPILLVVFCTISLFQNLIVQKFKSNYKWFITFLFYLILVIFFFYPSWLYVITNFILTLVVFLPIYIKARFHKI